MKFNSFILKSSTIFYTEHVFGTGKSILSKVKLIYVWTERSEEWILQNYDVSCQVFQKNAGYCSIWKQLLFFLSVKVHPFFLDIQIGIENIFILFSLFCMLYVQAIIQGLQNQCKRTNMFSLKIDIVKDYTSNYFSFLILREITIWIWNLSWQSMVSSIYANFVYLHQWSPFWSLKEPLWMLSWKEN